MEIKLTESSNENGQNCEAFRNPKNWSLDQTGGFMKNQKKKKGKTRLELGLKIPFEF
jgi:hypothetical protein